MTPPQGSKHEVIEIVDDLLNDEDINNASSIETLIESLEDLEEEHQDDGRSTATTSTPTSTTTRRNQPITGSQTEVEEHNPLFGTHVIRGCTYLLRRQYHGRATFLYVRQIVKDPSAHRVLVRGLPVFLNKHLNGILDWGGYAKYDTYMSANVDRDDARPWHVQGMIELPAESIDRLVPMYFSSEDYDRTARPEQTGNLTCRRALIKSFSSAIERISKQPRNSDIQHALVLLSGCCIHALEAPLTTSMLLPLQPHARDRPILQERARLHCPETRQNVHRLTCPYVSLFSGGGGDIRGAREAGMTPVLAIDKNEAANKTTQLNNPNLPILCDLVENLARYGWHDCRALHASFPCQFHSFCHTRPGENDDANCLASLGCKEAIEVYEPEIVTTENVPGLMLKKTSRLWFVTLLNQLAETRPGYNVRWGLIDFREYGLAPRRTRFVAFASRRGVPLPPFPDPTHGPKVAKPFATVGQALRSLEDRPHLTLNQVPHHCKVFERPRTPYDPETKVLGCITTNGGEDNVHPSGTRSFTIRELAALNGIPLDYQFPEVKDLQSNKGLPQSEIVKQIGNCIPPAVWKLFMESVLDTLTASDNGWLDEDGLSIRSAQDQAGIDRSDIVYLESDDEEDGRDSHATVPLLRGMRHISVSTTRSPTRTLSPQRDQSERPNKRARSNSEIDLTGDD